MAKYCIPKLVDIMDFPEIQRWQEWNPSNDYNSGVTGLLGRAIHWVVIFQILWPEFTERDSYSVNVEQLLKNDPELGDIPDEIFAQITEILKTFWTIQLTDLYPGGEWEVEIFNDPETSVLASIHCRMVTSGHEPEYIIRRMISLEEIPEYRRLVKANGGVALDELQTATQCVRAIHWVSFIFQMLWPDFEKEDCIYIEEWDVWNDPDRNILPDVFYEQVQEMLKVFWSIQLDDLYPNGDWLVETWGQNVQATIRSRNKK